ncbi:uncharacterized protein [Diadema antillarum]|uniref:uncharacterized protein n=2 Tax=Diadema antillarum TaxID=105358 RepID=UPI003A8639F5
MSMNSFPSRQTNRSRPTSLSSTNYSNRLGHHRGTPSRSGIVPESHTRQRHRLQEPTPRMSPGIAQLGPDERQRVYEEVLEANRPFLCKHLDPGRHFSYLRSKRHFDLRTVELIKHNVTSEDKVNCFIDQLMIKGPDAVAAFLDSLLQNRVEQFVFSRLADACQTFPLEHANGAVNYRPFDYDVDEDESVNAHDDDCFRGASPMGASPNHAPETVLPPVDPRLLFESQGFPAPRQHLEPEEGSDISSSNGELSPHGN